VAPQNDLSADHVTEGAARGQGQAHLCKAAAPAPISPQVLPPVTGSVMVGKALASGMGCSMLIMAETWETSVMQFCSGFLHSNDANHLESHLPACRRPSQCSLGDGPGVIPATWHSTADRSLPCHASCAHPAARLPCQPPPNVPGSRGTATAWL